MIISHKHRFIYIKTYKTASTSTEIALSQLGGKRDIFTPVSSTDEKIRRLRAGRKPQNFRFNLLEIPTARMGLFIKDATHYLLDAESFRQETGRPLVWPHYKFWNHMPAVEIRDAVGAEVWDTYFKFTTERNPWDYVVSLYLWRKKSGHRVGSFSEFVNSPGINVQDNRKLYTIDNEIVVDKVMAFETLDDDMEAVQDRLSIPDHERMSINSIITKKTDRGAYREYYDDRTRDAVQKSFHWTIEQFGYRF